MRSSLSPAVSLKRFSAACAFALALSGCSIPIPQAEKDPTRFYVLATTPAAVEANANAPIVQLRHVELAHYLNARPLIVRRGDNEIEFREFARWGEPLESGIARVLREELIARGAARAVIVPGVRREGPPAGEMLTVRVLACEGQAGGAVLFRAVWEASPTAAGPDATVRSGDFRAADLRWDGKSEASLAAALSQAVASLAAEIATALKK